MHRLITLIVITLIVGLAIGSTQGKTIHVKVGGTGDGSSWSSAYGSLQDALDDAEPNDSIWVAEGTYKPTKLIDPCDPRTAAFHMKYGVGVYGGFSAIGVLNCKDRDWEEHKTVLSGDLLGNDVVICDPCDLIDDPCRADNCYHVLYGTGLAILDGFTISGGNANFNSGNNTQGGGMFNSGSQTLINCTFSDNASSYEGGGMYNHSGSPTLINCTFRGNTSYFGGGGIYNHYSSGTITGCTFIGNRTTFNTGGGIGIWGSNPTITNCIFINNSSNFGGGIYTYNSYATITNCIFSGNASPSGGGIRNSFGSLTVTNCTFSGNTSTKGGGISNIQSEPNFTNCTFYGNSADYGGGMFNLDYSYPTLRNCIFWGNTASSGPQIYNELAASAIVSHSDVQGGWAGIGNIDIDPLYIDPNGIDGTIGTEDDNLHLLPYSPCIDAGDPTGDYTDQTDMDGEQRVLYDNIDIGADEVFPIAGDIDMDGDVDFRDFAYFSGHWLKGK